MSYQNVFSDAVCNCHECGSKINKKSVCAQNYLGHIVCLGCIYLIRRIKKRTGPGELASGKLFEWLRERADDDGSIEHCESVNSIEYGCIALFYERCNKNRRV